MPFFHDQDRSGLRRSPDCPSCPIADLCDYRAKTPAQPGTRGPSGARRKR